MFNLTISKKSILILTVFTLTLHTVRCDGEDTSNLSNRMFKKKPSSSYTTGELSSSDELLSDSDVRILSNDSDSPVDKSKNSTIIFGVHKESESNDNTKCKDYYPECKQDIKSMTNCNSEYKLGQPGFIYCCQQCFQVTKKWRRQERIRRREERKRIREERKRRREERKRRRKERKPKDDTPKDGDKSPEPEKPKIPEDKSPKPEQPDSPDYEDWGFDNIHGMPKIHLDFTPIQNRIESNSRCSNTEIDQIMKGIKGVKPWVDKTYADWDKRLYEKWFGTVNDNGLSDKQVFHRFKRAYDFMYDEDPKWEVMCCDQAIGGCSSCSNGTLAYVTYWYYPGDKDSHRKNVHIRLCPDLFNTEDATEVIGVTMFHEVMHITSHAGDSCYSKKDCYNLAQTEPSKARLNANSYT